MPTLTDINITKYSGDPRVDSLLGVRGTAQLWNYLAPERTTLYYTFNTALTPSGFSSLGVEPFNEALQTATRSIMAYVASVTGIGFAETGSSDSADFHFSSRDLDRAIGLMALRASFKTDQNDVLTYFSPKGFIMLDNVEARSLYVDLTPGTSAYAVLLHEIGHALGLSHPHEGPYPLPAAQDSTNVSVMSYNKMGGARSVFQSYDLLALHWIYGGDGLGGTHGINSTRGPSLLQDTTPPTALSFSPADEAGSVALKANVVVTFSEAIYRNTGDIVLKTDAGVVLRTFDVASSPHLQISGNTLTVLLEGSLLLKDASGYKLEIPAGSFRDVNDNNFAGVNTYNFTTVSVPRLVVGTERNDNLTGSRSNDTINGGAGLDSLFASGASTQYLLTFDASNSTYKIQDTVSSRDGTDQLSSVERILFTDGLKPIATPEALMVARVYQSLFGKAPANATFNESLAKFAPPGSVWDWAKGQAASLSSLSDSAFTSTILNNMSITNTSLKATAAFGTSQQVYDSLLQAVANYLTAVGSSNRGIVMSQLADIIAGFEGETTFGVYGAAATAFNRQVASDIAHSFNAKNTSDVAVVPVFAGGSASAAGNEFAYMVSPGIYAYTIAGFGSGDKIVGPAGLTATLVNSSSTDGSATIQYAVEGGAVTLTLTGLTPTQDIALVGIADLNTIFGAGTV